LAANCVSVLDVGMVLGGEVLIAEYFPAQSQRDSFDRNRPTGLGPGKHMSTVGYRPVQAQGRFHSPPGDLMIEQT
jgi:hypothetical protein